MGRVRPDFLERGQLDRELRPGRLLLRAALLLQGRLQKRRGPRLLGVFAQIVAGLQRPAQAAVRLAQKRAQLFVVKVQRLIPHLPPIAAAAAVSAGAVERVVRVGMRVQLEIDGFRQRRPVVRRLFPEARGKERAAPLPPGRREQAARAGSVLFKRRRLLQPLPRHGAQRVEHRAVFGRFRGGEDRERLIARERVGLQIPARRLGREV